MIWEKFLVLIDQHRLVYAVIGALIVASLLTAISMALYVSSGASRLDLSRPGYERFRENVQRASSEEGFSSTGPLNSSVVTDFQQRFGEHRETLNKLDTFSSNALDDAELQIAPSADTPR